MTLAEEIRESWPKMTFPQKMALREVVKDMRRLSDKNKKGVADLLASGIHMDAIRQMVDETEQEEAELAEIEQIVWQNKKPCQLIAGLEIHGGSHKI